MSSFQTRLVFAKDFDEMAQAHDVCFTHGNFQSRKVMTMYDGRVSEIIDWEMAGYYPAYWIYTNAWSYSAPGGYWFDVIEDLADLHMANRKGNGWPIWIGGLSQMEP